MQIGSPNILPNTYTSLGRIIETRNHIHRDDFLPVPDNADGSPFNAVKEI